MMTDGFLRDLPKIQLHCHLEGTLRAATFLDLARRHGVALTYRPKGGEEVVRAADLDAVDPESLYRFTSFQDFLMTFAAVSRSLAQPADYGRQAAEYVQDAVAQNVVYAELFISPSVWQFFHPEIDVRACVREMRDAFDAVRDRLEVALIADVTRNFGPESGMRTAQLAARLQEFGVIGIGLGGDEARFPAELFEEVYAFARAQGLHTVAHAGEAAGAQSVRAAIDILGAERIGHGIRALEDPEVVRMLADRRIPLEICPTSNMLTGVATREQAHPLVHLDAAECIVTIDADDPALFRTSVTDEYAYVEQLAGREALLRFVKNAVDASFAHPARKAALHTRLEPYVSNVGA
jgi:adenosine deaminase/aminodeoxyfutalosine deaminase